MRILMVASEALPYAKTGGLADVLGALPGALAALGHEVDVLMPRYRGIEVGAPLTRLDVGMGAERIDAPIVAETDGRVRMLFVDRPEYFDRDYLYGTGGLDYADNPVRFGFLAAVGNPRQRGHEVGVEPSPGRREVLVQHVVRGSRHGRRGSV